MTIKATGGNQNTMANYLPVVLSPTMQDWLMGLPTNSINSWGDLCAKYINNFQETFTKPGVEWDLYQIAQKKNESLRDYIKRFMKKKNTIPGVSDAVVMASFRTGVRNPGPQAGGPAFPDPEHQLNMIYGGSDAYESKRKQKLITREINAITPATPKYLKWSEAPITFSRADHPDDIPHPGRYPLVLDPIVWTIKLNRVLIDGGSGLNILFTKTLDDMKIPCPKLNRSPALFHGVIPRTSAVPLGQISLPVTLGTRENFRTENISFDVADFEAAYNAILGRPALAKFMVVPHCIYMMMKLPGPNGIISLQRDIRRSYNCDQESCTLAENIQAKADRGSIRLAAAVLQEEEEVPAKKAAKSRISPTKTSRKSCST